MEIKSLVNTRFEELFDAFERAFADYEVQLNKAELCTMLKRRGFDPKLSFAAFDGPEIVSFTCNGVGIFNGIPTAYDTGTGTLKDYQGKGLATQVFEYSIPYLRAAGIKTYLLEVLQHNAGAISVYRKLGFEATREFYYFEAENDRIKGVNKIIDSPYVLQRINIHEHKSIPEFWDFTPSWQNNFDAIDRAPEDFICLGVFAGEQLVGYGVFEPSSGDVTQIAVSGPYRRKGVGSLLFRKMLELNVNSTIKIVNTDVGCNSITAFLESWNIGPSGKQFEMTKRL